MTVTVEQVKEAANILRISYLRGDVVNKLLGSATRDIDDETLPKPLRAAAKKAAWGLKFYLAEAKKESIRQLEIIGTAFAESGKVEGVEEYRKRIRERKQQNKETEEAVKATGEKLNKLAAKPEVKKRQYARNNGTT